MNTSISIRLATLADIAPIMLIIKEVMPLMRATGNMQWNDDYPNPEAFGNDIKLRQLWVACIDDDIAGVTAITTDQAPEYWAVGWDITETAIVTHRLAVSPRYRGKGVAERLLLQAETVATSRSIKLLRIDTNTQNEVAKKLFPKLGYVFAGEISLAFRPGLRFYCYEKRL